MGGLELGFGLCGLMCVWHATELVDLLQKLGAPAWLRSPFRFAGCYLQVRGSLVVGGRNLEQRLLIHEAIIRCGAWCSGRLRADGR